MLQERFFLFLDYHVVRRFGMKCWKKCVRFGGVGANDYSEGRKVNEISSLSLGGSSGGYESLEKLSDKALVKRYSGITNFPYQVFL